MDQTDFDTERCVNAADIAKCRFAFDSAADRASALLDGISFRAVALALGYRLTDSQIQEILRPKGSDHATMITFDKFLEMLPRNTGSISEEEHGLADLREKFQRLDCSGDGHVTLHQAQGALQQELGVAPQIALGLLNQFVKLNYEQFIKFYQQIQQTKLNLYEKFGKYDTNQDGMISVGEAHQILQKELGYTETRSRATVNRFDVNNDGQVSYIEFADFYFAIEDKKEMIRQTFKKFDEDGDGFVTSKQARHVLQDVLGFSAQKSETTMATYDRKNDGKIVYEDFIEFYSMVEEERDRLLVEFRRFDKNKDGRISEQELSSLLAAEGRSAAEVHALMEGYDLDGDGFLDIDEFKKYLNFT